MYINIEIELTRNHLTKKELSEKLNVSQTTLRRWIRKETDIPSSKLVDMSKIFNCGVDYLLIREDSFVS